MMHRKPRRWIAAITVALLWSWQPATAQVDNTQRAMELYQQVVTGQRNLDSLSPTDRTQVLMVARAMRSSCSSNSHKCEALCEATNQLESTSRDLVRCAAEHDYTDSCDKQFRDVRDAHDELENAVSEASGDCD